GNALEFWQGRTSRLQYRHNEKAPTGAISIT
ncbi:MAG: hypothetical protein HC803_02925, partial [Saprospiraceae bacterium]|nr:hypothetical protein [Saprospiraceae bacterium]